MEAAEALGRRMLDNGGDSDAERVAYGFRRVLSRPPKPAESRALLALLQRQRQRQDDRSAYTMVARVMLNVDAENPTGATALYERVGMRIIKRWDLWERSRATPQDHDGLSTS